MPRIVVDLVVGDVPVGDHHQQQQLDHGLVLAVGGGVHRDVAVEVAEGGVDAPT